MCQIYVEDVCFRPKYDASLDRKLTGAIRDQPGFDNGMAVRKTRLLLQKRLKQAIIQLQTAADAWKNGKVEQAKEWAKYWRADVC